MDKENFIDRWRTKFGCEHDSYSMNLCWCEVCAALEKLWHEVIEIRKSDSEGEIRKEFWRYIPEKEWYIYLLGEGDSVSFSSEECGRLSTYFFPGRYKKDRDKEQLKNIRYTTYDIGLVATNNHKNKIFLVVKNPEVELNEIDFRGRVCYLHVKRNDLNF